MSPRSSLASRIVILMTILILGICTVLGVSSVLIVQDSVQRTLQERLVLAEATASHLDYVLKSNLDLLQSAGTQKLLSSDEDLESEQRTLRETYFHTIFNDGVYIADRYGRVLRREPAYASAPVDISEYEHVKKALSTGKLVISNVYFVGTAAKPVVSVAIPIRDGFGAIVGLVGGDINPTDTRFQRIVEPVGLGPSGYVEVVDGRGVVLASNVSSYVLTETDHSDRLATLIREGRTTVGTCHDCHSPTMSGGREAEVMAFAPLGDAPWGVLVRDPEREALAPARSLQWRSILVGMPSFAIAVALAWAFSLSITRPLRELTAAADRIASGDLSVHVRDFGNDEVGQLARSFDKMRRRLGESLEEVRRCNRGLESRVAERTRELEASYREIREKDRARRELLRKVISAQEDERKRIARELHDETSQALAALLVAIDAADVAMSQNGHPSDDGEGAKASLVRVRKLAAGTLDGVHKLIYDLRPSLLDDLGLLPAIGWYAESRLQPLGIKVHVEVEGEERRLEPQVETALFRIIQEAITNVARHAKADNAAVSISFGESSIDVEIEDDGCGFDVGTLKAPSRHTGGFGLLGMKERVFLLGGTIEIESDLDGGTRIKITVPLGKEDVDAED